MAVTLFPRSAPSSAIARPALLFALGAAACWGLSVVAAKAAVDRGLPALSLATLQLMASVALLTVLASRRSLQSIRATLSRSTLASGALEYGLTASLFAFGITRTTAGNAALINAAEPVLIVLAAALFLRERLGRRLVLPLVAVTVGLLLVMSPDLMTTGVPRGGDFLVLASAATGALYAILSRRLVESVDPLPLALTQEIAGLALLLGFLLLASSVKLAEFGAVFFADPAALLLAVGSGLLAHAGAVWLHLHALKRMPASVFALFLGLVPVFALAGAGVMLGETITLSQVVGGVIVVAAAIASSRSINRQSHSMKETNP